MNHFAVNFIDKLFSIFLPMRYQIDNFFFSLLATAYLQEFTDCCDHKGDDFRSCYRQTERTLCERCHNNQSSQSKNQGVHWPVQPAIKTKCRYHRY